MLLHKCAISGGLRGSLLLTTLLMAAACGGGGDPTDAKLDTQGATPTPIVSTDTPTHSPTALVTPSPTSPGTLTPSEATTSAHTATPSGSQTPSQSTTPTQTGTPTGTQTPTPEPTPANPLGREVSLEQCTDGIDNDRDGFTDCADFSCVLADEGAYPGAQTHCIEEGETSAAQCQDGIDNDGDGHIDCEDWSCNNPDFGASQGALEICELRPTPTPIPTPTPTPTPTPVPTPLPSDLINEASYAACSDGIDNDDDGHTDCGDWSCYLTDYGASPEAQAYCFQDEETSLLECSDGLDNDNDGYIDCGDWSCSRAENGASDAALSFCNGTPTPVPTPTPTALPSCYSGDGYCEPGCTDVQDSDCVGIWSCGEEFPGYVPWLEGVENLEDNLLVDALNELIDDHQGLGYDAARERMYGDTDDIDVDPDGYVECIYTGYRTPADGSKSPGEISTEHSWPKSDGAGDYPAEGDIHHLFPATATSNTKRSSHEFGNTDCGTSGNGNCDWAVGGSSLGESNDGRSGLVFEVRSEYRGDIARAHFYFATRYNKTIGSQEEAVLKQWHCEDPPDADEVRRNGDIEYWQNNRNPFVDRPDFVLEISDF